MVKLIEVEKMYGIKEIVPLLEEAGFRDIAISGSIRDTDVPARGESIFRFGADDYRFLTKSEEENMKFVQIEIDEGIAILTLNRGKVNALNNAVVDELRDQLKTVEADSTVTSVILTGQGSFFSFGFDIPEFLSFDKEAFTAYLTNFTSLYTYLFLYPKPVVAALNGHTIAGGCMLALACDSRMMAAGKGKISLNEIAFGASVFAGSTEMLRFLVGSATAADLLYSGAMYTADQAKELGLVQQVIAKDNLMTEATRTVSALGAKYPPAFAGIKSLLRKPVAEEMVQREKRSIREFVDIWYSDATWANLLEIKIH